MMINMDKGIIDRFGNPPERKLEDVTEIVIHHTAGDGSWKALKNWILSDTCERKAMFKKFVALTHFYIDKDGTINQIYFLDRWTYHSCSGKHDKQTVGIEMVHSKGEFKEAQYNSLADLIQHITTICPVKTIVSHDYNYMTYSKKAKGCPGNDFKWGKLDEMLKARGITLNIRSVA